MKSYLLLLFLAATAFTTAWGQTSTVTQVINNGPRTDRINIVFLSEGYTTASMPNFAGHVDTAVNYLFGREPWQQYRNFCNVFRIQIASTQDGTDNGTGGGTKNTYFSTGFYDTSTPQLLSIANGSTGYTRIFSLLNTHVPEYDVAILLVNDIKYGGSGGTVAIASVNQYSAQVVEHELGHSFANLADEYDIQYPGFSPSEQLNNTAQTNRSLIKWRHWIDSATPVPTPETATYDEAAGLFEGSMYRTSGWYRPHNNSVMRNLTRPVGQVNREQFVLQFYSRVSPLNSFSPGNSSTISVTNGYTPLSFSVSAKTPIEGPAPVITWRVDGVVQAGQTLDSFNPLSDALGNGTRTITATVQDPTPFVRADPTNLLNESISWTLNLSNQLPNTLASWRTAYGADTLVISADNLSNLMKYALGVNPSTTLPMAQRPRANIQPQSSQNYLTMSVPRRLRRTDVTYIVETTSDLITWNTGPGHTVTLVDSETQLTVRDAVAMAPSVRRFIRVRIAAP
jgi:IgA Peptidase M64